MLSWFKTDLCNKACPNCKKNLWNYTEQKRANEKRTRLALPQFITGDGRSIGFDIFEESITNSLEQFNVGKNNMLILCPNSFAEMRFFGSIGNWYHLRALVKRLDIDHKLSCIGVFEVSLYEDTFHYHCPLISINNYPRLNDDVPIYKE